MAMTESKWDADDLVQEALLRALPVVTGEKPHMNPTAYVLRIARNSWIDRKRRERFETEDRKLPADFVPDKDPQASLIDVEAAMEQLVRQLPPMQITVFLLRDVFKYTAAEVAGWLQTTEGAIKAALHRARGTIRALHANPSSADCHPANTEPPSEDVLEAYMRAFRQADPQALVLLAMARTKQVDVTAVVGQYLSGASQQSQVRASVAFESPYAQFAAYAHYAA